jgi:hypothetical protein
MKYCYECGRITGGEPLFCNFCGRSYDVKLCPRHHANPRYADCCSQCGSRELSTPQPKVSFWWRVLEFLLRVLLGVVLAALSIALAGELLRNSVVQGCLLILALLLAGLWAIWAMLPDWLRKLVYRLLKRKQEHHERE